MGGAVVSGALVVSGDVALVVGGVVALTVVLGAVVPAPVPDDAGAVPLSVHAAKAHTKTTMSIIATSLLILSSSFFSPRPKYTSLKKCTFLH